MCGDPSPETFGVSENARRPLAGDFRGVGKRAATPRRGLSGCQKMCGDPSPETFGVSESVRRPLAGDFPPFRRSSAGSLRACFPSRDSAPDPFRTPSCLPEGCLRGRCSSSYRVCH